MSLSIDNGEDEVKLEKGSLLFKQGDASDFLYIIKSGEVVCFSSVKGQIVPLFTSIEHDLVGDEASVDAQAYDYNAVATEDSVLVKVPAKDIQTFLNTSPKWMKDLFKHLSEQIIETQQILSEHVIRDELLTLKKELSPEKLQFLTKALKN